MYPFVVTKQIIKKGMDDMKKTLLFLIAALFAVTLLAGCNAPEITEPSMSEEPSSAATETVETTIAATETAPTETEAATEEDVAYEGDASSYYRNVVYAEQIARYFAPLSEKWNEEQYHDNGMSEVLAAYYEGNPLENVGFGFVDLDNDGRWELVIGAILDAEDAPAVFEIWTLVDEKPVMLAQANARNQYSLQYVEEDNMWYVAYESTNSGNGTYYLMLNEGEFEVVQGIIYNSKADAQNPWFMTYDLDWDTSNDEHIDEETAYAILDANRAHYTALEYCPYLYY